MRSIRRTRVAVLLVTGWLLAPLAPAADAGGPVVLPGYDLFTTLSNSEIGVDLDGPAGPGQQAVVRFASEPLGSFDFGAGPRDVGSADTIVHRFEAATPADGLGAIELVALQLRSIEPVGYYATLQSDRGRHPLDPPDGLRSFGTIDIAFAPDGRRGTFHAELLVNYDIRQGSAAGPIIAMNSASIQGDDHWQSAAPNQALTQCHPGHPVHTHCFIAAPTRVVACGTAVSAIPAIRGVNHQLNGRNQSSDFHPGHSTESGGCGTALGGTCQVASSDLVDALVENPGTHNGALSGGPFVSADGATMTVRCSVQVSAANSTHAGADAAAASATGSGVTALAATVSYVVPEGQPVFVCTQVTFNGVTFYYDETNGTFSLSPSVSC